MYKNNIEVATNMSTELKMRSLRLLNNMVLKVNQNPKRQTFVINVNQESLIVTSTQK
jgi:hypothetical protein